MAQGGDGGNNFVGLDGKPLRTKAAGLIVIKSTVEASNGLLQTLPGIAKVTGCDVIVLPMNCELLLGRLAIREIKATHKQIHEIAKQWNVNLDIDSEDGNSPEEN
jgi:hypothetical protein